MAGYQFIHVETYARVPSNRTDKKQSARNIAREAERHPGACPHVANPLPAKLMYGCTPSEAVDLAESRASMAVDRLGRKLRKDAQILLGGVVSYPVPLEQLTPDDEDLKQWLKLNFKFLRNKYRDTLKSIVAHFDESSSELKSSYFHLHFYVVPELTESKLMSISQVHQGIKARELVGGAKAKAKMRAYKDAMRAFQDEYFEYVGKPCGLTKDGPKRRRLSRKEWKSDQAAAERQAEAIKYSDEINRTQEFLLQEEKRHHREEARIKSDRVLLEQSKEKYLMWASNKSKTIRYLKAKAGQLLKSVTELKSQISSLKNMNETLNSQISELQKKTRKLELVNEKLSYQNEIKSNGLKDLRRELSMILELISSGKLNEIYARLGKKEISYDY